MLHRLKFEFRAFGDEANAPQETLYLELEDKAAARMKAGRMAKRINGPVDIAYAGAQPWEKRYITTAAPSAFHASGFRFERLM